MTPPRETYRAALRPLLGAALHAPDLRVWAGGYLTVSGRRIDDRFKDSEIAALEAYLIAHSGLPAAPDTNLLLAFADVVRSVCRDETISLRTSYNAVAWLLEGWRFVADAPILPDAPRVILPCCALVGTGVHAAAFRAVAEGVRTLMRAGSGPAAPIRESAVFGLRLMLAEDWPHTLYELRRYAHIGDAAEHALAAAALADPPLLADRSRALDALDLLHDLMAALRRIPEESRARSDVDLLAHALGRAVEAAVEAAPETGSAAVRTWLTWGDAIVADLLQAVTVRS